jgi:hypothetical protein
MSTKTYRTEETVTYALRHRPSGKIVKLQVESNFGRDDCGEETCRLTLDTDGPNFEVNALREIAVVMQCNEQWYNSSRSRPMWNGLDFKQIEVVRIRRCRTFDGPVGSDPIEERQTIQAHPFPGFVDGTRLKTRRLPSPLVRRYFDADLSSGDLDRSEVAIVSFEQRPDPADLIGQYLGPGAGFDNTGIVEAVADLPEGYLIDSRVTERLNAGEHLMIALINFGEDRLDLRPTFEGASPQP